jgi:hypothetical protein
MTMRWFGESWGAPILDEIPQVDVPFGAVCVWCEELIDDDDSGIIYANGPVSHRDCFIRQAVGGLNHVEGRCTCQGGSEPPDPPGISRREAARLAVEAFRRKHDGGG